MRSRLFRVLAGTLIGLAALPAFLFAQPRLLVPGGTSFDFGEVINGRTAEQLLILRNTGSATLVISNLVAGCGCTGTLLSNDHIAPGDSGLLSITFNSSSFLGHVEKGVNFETNDTAHRRMEIHFTATVIRLFELDPEYLFLKGAPGSTTSRSLRINNSGNREINFLSVAPSSPMISATLSRMSIKPGEGTTLTGSITPKAAGTYTGNIQITTDDPREPVLTIRFFSWVRDDSTAGGKDRN